MRIVIMLMSVVMLLMGIIIYNDLSKVGDCDSQIKKKIVRLCISDVIDIKPCLALEKDWDFFIENMRKDLK